MFGFCERDPSKLGMTKYTENFSQMKNGLLITQFYNLASAQMKQISPRCASFEMTGKEVPEVDNELVLVCS